MGHCRTPQADSDLDDIWFYVASQSGSLDIADRLVESITSRFFLIASHPNLGRSRDYVLRAGLRSFPVGEYVIIYRVQEDDFSSSVCYVEAATSWRFLVTDFVWPKILEPLRQAVLYVIRRAVKLSQGGITAVK